MERTHKQGNPINPINRITARGEITYDGMDEVAYFAAHAPEVPGWFQVEKIPNPEKPVPAPEIEAQARSWLAACSCDYDFAESFTVVVLPGSDEALGIAAKPSYWVGYRPVADKFETEWNAYKKECDRIEQINVERRYFQWRWYYGEQMAAHRGRD